MPTDMRALQDFEEEDKLQITMNDVITIIEGRSVCVESKFSYKKQFLNKITGFESQACVCQCRMKVIPTRRQMHLLLTLDSFHCGKLL